MTRKNRYPLLALLAAGLAACSTGALAQNAEAVLAGVRHTVFTVIASETRHGVINVLAQGSAVLVAPERLVTSCSVVDNATAVAVSRRGDRIAAKTRLTHRDPSTGLCELGLLQAQPGFDRPAEMASGDSLRVEAAVFTIGSPDGMALKAETGRVSALHEAADGQRFILITTPLTPGLRGAGLFDAGGRLIGIVAAAATDAQTPGFAVAPQSIFPAVAPAAGTAPAPPAPPRTATGAAAPQTPIGTPTKIAAQTTIEATTTIAAPTTIAASATTAVLAPAPAAAPAAPAATPREPRPDLSARLAGSGDNGAVRRRYRELLASGELAGLEDDEAIAGVYATLINDEVMAQMRWDEEAGPVAEFEVRLHRSGEVMFALPLRRSGLEHFDLAAQRAIGVASPFPVPVDDAAFGKMQSLVLVVKAPKRPAREVPKPTTAPPAPKPSAAPAPRPRKP